MNTYAIVLLRDLVVALDKAFISTWQSTHYWQQELDAAREYLDESSSEKSTPGIDTADRAMLENIFEQLDTQSWPCARCGFEEPTSVMDVYNELKEYLGHD